MSPSTKDLLETLESLTPASFTTEAERVQGRDALFEALRRVQSPWDIVWDHCWVTGATNASVKALIEAGVFAKWNEVGGGEKTTKELAKLVGADEVLIKRLLHQISGQDLVVEVAPDTFVPTPWSTSLATDPALAACYGGFYHQLNNPMFRTLPFFLKENGFKNPTDVNHSNWQYCHSSPNNLFQDLAINPEMAGSFHQAMQCHSKYNLAPWTDAYPTETIIEASKAKADPGRVLVVDVGGSKGHDLEKFRVAHPDIADGSLVLQDLPDVVKDLKLHSSISIQGYDFFTPQPIKGARVYFMHNVLHDWTDDLAIKIIENVAKGMVKGYSRLLIHESLVSSVKPLARVTTSDLTMMACLSAKERTEREWSELVERAGLKVVRIWRPAHSVESIIEAESV